MIVTRQEILDWMYKLEETTGRVGTIMDYALAHDIEPQVVIDLMNGKAI